MNSSAYRLCQHCGAAYSKEEYAKLSFRRVTVSGSRYVLRLCARCKGIIYELVEKAVPDED